MMRKYLFFILVLVLTGCIREQREDSYAIQPGDRLPDFQVQMADGSYLSSASLIGSPCVIVFFHTTCVDCQKTLPVIQQAFRQYGETVRFVAISRAQAASEISSWWTENGITLPFSAQEDRSVYQLFASSRIPRVYICNSRGVVVKCFDDNPCPTFQDLEQALNGLEK